MPGSWLPENWQAEAEHGDAATWHGACWVMGGGMDVTMTEAEEKTMAAIMDYIAAALHYRRAVDMVALRVAIVSAAIAARKVR